MNNLGCKTRNLLEDVIFGTIMINIASIMLPFAGMTHSLDTHLIFG